MIEQKSEYDRASTVFSPEGLLYQVQYAMEAVNRGGTVVGITSREGAVLVADKKQSDRLIESRFIEKIFVIDTHIALGMAGLVGDGRRLIYDAMLEAQRNRYIYDEPIDITELTNRICQIKQIFTQYAGLRPFGVSFLIAGVDYSGCRLFETDPSSTPIEWKAAAIGADKTDVMDFIVKNYHDNLTLQDAINLSINSLKHVCQDKLTADNLEMVIIPTSTGIVERIDMDRLKKFLKS